MAKDGEEHNYVGDNYNWEKRCEHEVKSAKIWGADWGHLYEPGVKQDYQSKIDECLKKANAIKTVPLMAVSPEVGDFPPDKLAGFKDIMPKLPRVPNEL